MRIAIARETDSGEPRVAATPETVKKMIALGAEVAVEPGAGEKSGILDADFAAAGATVGKDAAKGADVVLKVRRPDAAETLKGYKKGALVIAIMDPYGNAAALKALGGCRRHRLRHGADAAHHARAVDGRALEPGQSRRLPRRDRCRRRIRPRLPDDDDRGRHRAGGQDFRDGRRCRGPASDRHRAPARRHRHRHRRAARRQGTGAKPRREIHRGRGRGIQAGRNRRRLRQGNVEGVSGQAGGAGRRAHQEAGHRHHHRADPRPARAAPGRARRWWRRCGPAP